MRRPFSVRHLSVTLGPDGQPPTEFRLFSYGWNDTEKGKFLFDQKAAADVMSAYKKWSVDVSIDLEHQMLDDQPSPDPTSKDARGWCNLELKADGSLWAVNVKWTPDGEARLTQKRQRYISPAFSFDPESKRIEQIINVAITSIPATHGTPALVAASRKKQQMTKQGKKALAMIAALAASGGMTSALVSKAMQALQDQDGDAALDILKAIIASAAGGEPDADGEGDPSDGPDSSAVPEQNSAAGANPKDDNNAPPNAQNENGPPAKPEKASVVGAAISNLLRLTGANSLSEAVSKAAEYQASHMELETGRQALAKEREVLESAERRKLCAELVKLGAEFPSTIWEDMASKTPKARWQKMPIGELRSHIEDQRKARGVRAPTASIQPPSAGSFEVLGLTETELKICEEQKCDPKVYAQLKAQRDNKTIVGG